mmetsp:Transcript_6681/g.17103  ORF Transcript_6681/g.17103 Transcript_6681/m.17103 type:complete len:303 (-) Transcript_6681:117-1025(-)
MAPPHRCLHLVLLEGPGLGGVGVAVQELAALLGEALVRAKRARRLERGLVLLEVLEPLLGVVRAAVVGEPWPALCVVDRLGQAVAGVGLVPLHQEVPLVIDVANERVVCDPAEAVQEAAGLGVDHVEVDAGVGGVATVVQHHGGPVLAWVRLLLAPRQLHVHRGVVIVLHAHHGVFVVHLVQQLRDVAQPQEVVVREQRPPLVVVQVRHEEPAVRELRGLLGVHLARVHCLLAQLLPLQRDHADGHGRVLLHAVLRHLVGDVLVAVVADVAAEGHVLGGDFLRHWHNLGVAIRVALLSGHVR